MIQTVTIERVHNLMKDFAWRTGLDPVTAGPQRYLWTDAFAVCNYLGLFGETGNAVYLDLALRLVDQVHHTLGRHCADDPRTGWISGLSPQEGVTWVPCHFHLNLKIVPDQASSIPVTITFVLPYWILPA